MHRCESPAADDERERQFLRYAHVFTVQTAYTALANARGKIEERLARWLLMTHDRVDGDKLGLTQKVISLMLGVRR
jgi:CRP-like cAMP-binding protein